MKEVRFDASRVSVELPNKRILFAKEFTCSGKLWNEKHRETVAPISHAILVEKLNCFLLFFESYPPNVDEEYKMRMGGVFVNDKSLSIPEITFRKGISTW
jgi:hypothetical protein